MIFCCKSCGSSTATEVADLGSLPISNALVSNGETVAQDPTFPLRILICQKCSLVQLAECLPAAAHFHSSYVYYSSHSQTWLAHCSDYANQMISLLGLQPGDDVLEIASNDGYLLQFFQKRGLNVLGIEPSESVASVAIDRGIQTEVEFFGKDFAQILSARGESPRLIVANNVLAHVPDVRDFVDGFRLLLKKETVLTCEVHYFRDLFENTQFDSFYHEHYFYYTIRAASDLFRNSGMRVFDVERLATHGGSLRLYVCAEEAEFPLTDRLNHHIEEENVFLEAIETQIPDFQQRIRSICENARNYLSGAKESGRTVVGYGAPAKATTLLNLAGIDSDLLPYTVDRNPHKQGQFLPGVRIPIRPPSVLQTAVPEELVILAWNLRDEIMRTCREDLGWLGQFVVFVPELERIEAE